MLSSIATVVQKNVLQIYRNYFFLFRYRAVFAYRPQNDDELELLEGDEVYVMEKCDDGWYVGTSNRTAMFGTFPGNYVQLIQCEFYVNVSHSYRLNNTCLCPHFLQHVYFAWCILNLDWFILLDISEFLSFFSSST